MSIQNFRWFRREPTLAWIGLSKHQTLRKVSNIFRCLAKLLWLKAYAYASSIALWVYFDDDDDDDDDDGRWWWWWWWLENSCCLPLPGCLHPPREISFKTDAPSKSRSVSAPHEIAPTLHRYLSKSKYIFVVKTFKRSCSRKGPWDGIYYRVLVSPPLYRLFNGPLPAVVYLWWAWSN